MATMGLAVNNITGWCPLSKQWRGVGQWLASGLSRQLCTVSRGPEGWRCPQDPCGEGFCCFLLLNPTYVSFTCRQGFVGIRPACLHNLAQYSREYCCEYVMWIHVLWLRRDKFTQTTECCGGKGTTRPLSQEESASTLSWQACIAFLGTLHWGWSSFTMHRFALAGYLVQKRKERMLLISSKRKDICQCKGHSG